MVDLGAKIGYEFTPQLSVYATVNYGFQKIAGGIDELATGFGMGVEVEYFFTEKVGAKLGYTQHSMEVDSGSITIDNDVKNVKLTLIYKF